MVRIGTVVRTLILCGLAMTTLASAKTDKSKTIVIHPSGYAVTQRLADLPVDNSLFAGHEMPEPLPSPLRSRATVLPGPQQATGLQKEAGPLVSATTGIDFDGIAANGFAPSDANMAVGPNHIVETVNVRLAIYDKTGNLLSGPTNFTTFFSALGGNCASGASDPIVLYDRQADRWVISDIGYTGSSPFLECVGVSTTNDPTGTYTLYSYSFGSNLNDYPKLSTWATASNSAYLATYNIFGGAGFAGADLCGMDRLKMLAGNPSAAQLCQMTPNTEGSYLPSEMDGPTPPVNGTPGLFITWQNNNPGQLFLRKLTLNFAGATATLSAATTINVANDNLACGSCVPQAGTSQGLDTLGDRMMYRFAIRHFPGGDLAVLNHAVGTGSGSQVGVRWYELSDPAGSVSLLDQGVLAPDTNTYRWMASIALDQSGDIGLGYSASSSSINPAIRFTGRVPSDPAGTLESEASLLVGTGSQTSGLSRWGDYTALQVDPIDDCTFWYVDQYEKVSGTFNWNTNIGSFVFTGCGVTTPDFYLSANPNSVAITQGNSGTSTITVHDLNGFSGSVTLSASGLPSGVTAGFGTNPTTSTSLLTLTASATAALGTVNVTITGVSGSLTHTTNITLTVNQLINGADISLTPGSLAFGTIVVGQSSKTKTATLTNSGTGTLNISNITVSGDFAQTTSPKPCHSTLAGGTSCQIVLVFTPTQLGSRTGTLSVFDNASNSPQTVALSGTGKAQVTLTPVSSNFPRTLVGTTSASKVFTLRNNLNTILHNVVISTTGDFGVSTTNCQANLTSNASCTINVVFTPTQIGARAGTLQVSDSANNSPQVSNLTGTGK